MPRQTKAARLGTPRAHARRNKLAQRCKEKAAKRVRNPEGGKAVSRNAHGRRDEAQAEAWRKKDLQSIGAEGARKVHERRCAKVQRAQNLR